MIRWATVVAKSPQWVELELIKKSACQGCTGQCHRPLFKLFSPHNDTFRINYNQTGLRLKNRHLLFGDDSSARRIGQQVGLEIDDDALLGGGFWFYVWPLVMIMVAMAAGHYFAVVSQQSPDLWALIGLLLALSGIFVHYRHKRHSSLATLPEVTIL